MSISNEIQKLQTNLTNSYEACNDKGATMPASQNFDNLADCIDSISTENVLKPYICLKGQRVFLSNNTIVQTSATTGDTYDASTMAPIKPPLTGTRFLLNNNTDDNIVFEFPWLPTAPIGSSDRSILGFYFLNESSSLNSFVLDVYGGYLRYRTNTSGSTVVTNTSYSVSYGIEYRFKIIVKRNSVKWSVSKDFGKTYTEVINLSYPTSGFYELTSIDMFTSSTYYQPCCVDLTQTKLTYNGQEFPLLEPKNNKTYNYEDGGDIPIINSNGILTGFKDNSTQSSFAIIPCPDFSNANSFDICLKFWLTNSPRTGNFALMAGCPTHQVVSVVVDNTTMQVGGAVGNSEGNAWQFTESTVHGTTAINRQVWYWYKISFTGTKYIGSISTDGETFTQEWEYTSSIRPYYSSSEAIKIGTNRGGSGNAITGCLDLNECYIKIDGETVWKGVN